MEDKSLETRKIVICVKEHKTRAIRFYELLNKYGEVLISGQGFVGIERGRLYKMREILFRGKRTDNGKWVYGSIVTWKNPLMEEAYILPATSDLSVSYGDNGERTRIGCFIRIDFNTACQYTGLCDKNGVKIFEGDIISIPNSSKKGLPAKVSYMKNGMFQIRRIGYVPISLEDSQFWAVVVGNIYDNPELLEGNNG